MQQQILIVDDVPVIRELLRRVLAETAGGIVTAADIRPAAGLRGYLARRVWHQTALHSISRFAEYLRNLEIDIRGDIVRDLCKDLRLARLRNRSARRQAVFVAGWAHDLA